MNTLTVYFGRDDLQDYDNYPAIHSYRLEDNGDLSVLKMNEFSGTEKVIARFRHWRHFTIVDY